MEVGWWRVQDIVVVVISGRDSVANTSGATFNIGHNPTYNGNTNGLFSEFTFVDGSILARPQVYAQDNGGTWSRF